jgi:hypothetical protein
VPIGFAVVPRIGCVPARPDVFNRSRGVYLIVRDEDTSHAERSWGSYRSAERCEQAAGRLTAQTGRPVWATRAMSPTRMPLPGW